MKNLVLFFLFGATVASAQQPGDFKNFNPRFEIFKLSGDLPGTNSNNNVQCIVQDSLGFLWFGTQGGLLRYDGQHVVTYRHDPLDSNSLASNHIEWICVARNGILWLGGDAGVSALDPKTERFTHYVNDADTPEGTSHQDNGAGVILEDRSGFIWLATQNGLNRLDPKTGHFKRFVHQEDDPRSLSWDEVRSLYEDKNGVLWVGCGIPFIPGHPDAMRGGLNRYDPKTETFTRFLHDPADPASLSDNRVRAILEDSRGNFWVGTAGLGLQLMDRKTGKFTRLPFDPAHPSRLAAPRVSAEEPPPYYHVTFLSEDQNGWIWMGTFDGGLNVFDPETNALRHFEMTAGMKDSLQGNVVWNFCETRDGTVWLATGDAGGVVYRVKSPANFFPCFDSGYLGLGYPVMFIGAVKDSTGDLWLQMRGVKDGLLRFDPAKGEIKKHLVYDPPLKRTGSPEFDDLSVDDQGNIWTSIAGIGFYRVNPKQDERLRPDTVFAPKIPFKNLCPPFFDRNGNCWVATAGDGLYRFGPNMELTHFSHAPADEQSIGGNLVEKVFEDRQGNIWAMGGSRTNAPENPMFFDRFEPAAAGTGGTFTHLLPPGEKGDAYRVVEDKNGVFWFTAFHSGIRKLNPKTGEYKSFTVANGALVDDKMHEIVEDKNGKIWMAAMGFVFELDPETEQIRYWSAQHGFQGLGPNFTGSCLGPDGQVVFSGGNVFHAFYPDAISSLKIGQPLAVRLTGLTVMNKRALPESSSFLQRPIWETTEIRLSHNQNIFSIQVATFEYNPNELSRMLFKLENYDLDWRSDLLEGEASYVNVPPGDYVFRVKGSNNMGVWSKETTLHIVVMPPWWRTWWAYSIYFLALAGAVFGYITYRSAALRNENRVLEEQVSLRTQSLVQKSAELEQSLTNLKSTQAQLIQSEKLASLGELTAGIAHEIQNPLNFVNNFAELSMDLANELKDEIKKPEKDWELIEDLTDDLTSNQEKINHHGKRASNIVKGMLEHSRASSGVKEPTDLNALADEYLRLSYHGLRAKDSTFNANMETDFDPAVGMVDVIPQDIGRVFLNIINNAFYAVSARKKLEPEGFEPTVTVSSKVEDGAVEFRIKDNGTGIPDDVKTRIFQPFFTTKPTGQGTGLGLSLAYDIVTKGHGGTLEVESAEGKGSEFIIQLPI